MFLNIDLPDTYEGAIVDTQVVNQETNTQLSIANSTLIRTLTDVDRSVARMQVEIINAGAEAQATRITNEAQGNITRDTISYKGMSYDYLQETVGLNTTEDLLDFIFYLNIENLDSSKAKLLVGLDSALVNLGASGKGYF